MKVGRLARCARAADFRFGNRSRDLRTRRQQLTMIVRAAIALAAVAYALPAAAQLRIVTYNTTGGPRSGMDFVLKAIGQENYNGVIEPIDVLLLQEQSRSAGLPDAQNFVTLLNSLYAGQGITYAHGSIIG